MFLSLTLYVNNDVLNPYRLAFPIKWLEVKHVLKHVWTYYAFTGCDLAILMQTNDLHD